jgi:hypothetical protein
VEKLVEPPLGEFQSQTCVYDCDALPLCSCSLSV